MMMIIRLNGGQYCQETNLYHQTVQNENYSDDP